MSRTRRFGARSAFGAAMAALFLSACATTEEPEGGVRIDQQNYVHPALNSVRVLDQGLAHYTGGGRVDSVLDVETVTLSTTPTGFRKLTVELRNKSHVAIPLDVRVSWYDTAGAPTDPAQSWMHVFLQPMSTATVEQSSSRQSSAQYYVEVRGAE